MNMYTQQLMSLGLAKNEAQIYEALLEHGELGVSEISKRSNIHRRNVYDCLNRLLEKGFVSVIVAQKENHYKAVNPQKLTEVIEEKRTILDKIMPDLEKLWVSKPHHEEVFILKGAEGYKNYMREILKTGEDLYTIGGGGLWGDAKIKIFFNNFLKELAKKGIKTHILYDAYVKQEKKEVLDLIVGEYKFLDAKYSTGSTIDIFGDYVVTLTKGTNTEIDDSTITVIKNRKIAEAFRIWFKLMWDSS